MRPVTRARRADIWRAVTHPLTASGSPWAEFIARAREDLAHALDAIDRVLAVAAKAEQAALPWDDPLPVPAWVAEICEVVSEGLAGQAGAR